MRNDDKKNVFADNWLVFLSRLVSLHAQFHSSKVKYLDTLALGLGGGGGRGVILNAWVIVSCIFRSC